MKSKPKRRNTAFALILSLCLSMFCSNSMAYAAESNTTVSYHGKVTYGQSTCGSFSVDGSRAYCCEHEKATPPTGTEVTVTTIENAQIAKVLYYGWGGMAQWGGFRSQEEGIVMTALLIDSYYNGGTISSYRQSLCGDFINYLNSQSDLPSATVYLYKTGSSSLQDLVGYHPYEEAVGAIQVHKTDTDGNNLSGAVFAATNTNTGEQHIIGPTNNDGYAMTENIPYGTYSIRETVYPTNYRSYGASSWTVTVSENNNGVATFDAVNEEIPGVGRIVKTSEDGVVSGIKFTISGNGVNKTVTTGANGTVDISLT